MRQILMCVSALLLLCVYFTTTAYATGEIALQSDNPNSKIITDIASVFIALCSFCFAIYQGLAIREHNKLSVKPHLMINDIYIADKDGVIGLQLINNGVGPAVIRHFFLLHKNKQICSYESDAWVTVLNDLGFEAGDLIITRWHPSDYIASKEEGWIFALKNNQKKDIFIKSLDSISFHIDYDSIYGNGINSFQTCEWGKNAQPLSSAQAGIAGDTPASA